MKLLPPTFRSPAQPRVYRQALLRGRREEVRPSIGMNEASALKVAWWRGSVVAEPSAPNHDFVALFLHSGGAPVHRADGGGCVNHGGSVMPGVLESEAWESDGVFEWFQFYISRALLDELAEERFGGRLAEILRTEELAIGSGITNRLASAAARELFSGEPPSALQLDSWAVLLADAWLRDHADPDLDQLGRVEAITGPRDPAMARVVELIDAHLDRAVSLDEMAVAAGLSRFHLVRRFRDALGQTPAAFARTRRIEHAKRLLRTTSLSITEIALACGFADQSHLSGVFARSTGMTPGRYRAAR